jgi:hypothetical protein
MFGAVHCLHSQHSLQCLRVCWSCDSEQLLIAESQWVVLQETRQAVLMARV